MNITIFGCGFVGGTVANFLEEKYEGERYNIVKVDPIHYPDVDPQQAAMEADSVIICVPTPSEYFGECDDSIVRSVLELCDERVPILLKSSVTPDLIEKYPTNVIYNPEFLREAHAENDFKNQHTFVLGHHKNNKEQAKHWADLFCIPEWNVVYTDPRTASMIKYTHNAWLATKVAWFHELYSELPPGIDYDTITSALGRFPTIGSTHMQVPNADGNLGYSGACFPKDVKALTKVIKHSILSTVKETNNKLNNTKGDQNED